jgi:KUP system potassium uptake protein
MAERETLGIDRKAIVTDQREHIHGDGYITREGGEKPSGKYLLALSLGALGVVYGDIGTSPIYAIRESLHAEHGISPTPDNILGILSLIFWALIIIISIKYQIFVLRCDNRGEGGILALTSLVTPVGAIRKGTRYTLILLGLFGAALLYGDSMLTPAISVLSAVEGIAVATPAFTPYVIPLTIALIVGLFTMQRRGTAGVAAIFAPIILIWFFTLGALGIWHIMDAPHSLAAVNPMYAARFLTNNGFSAFASLGSVFLVVTGGESLYMDVGHFGRLPIRLTWYFIVLPSLLLNYFGQGALLIEHPEAAENPFFLMAPEWGLIPFVVLTTLATIIASQAVISGAYSLTMQAVQLGYLPRVEIDHTSARERGQIYIPAINTALMLACIGLVLGFRSSSNLTAAYGVAVTTTMVCTTLLFYVVAHERWKWPKPAALALAGLFFIVDISFWASNVLKIPSGGWFPLVVATFGFALMTTWKTGRQILARRLAASSLPWDFFMADIEESPPTRVPGTAIFMYGSADGTPPALIHSLQYFGVLHQQVVLLRVETAEVPHLRHEDRVKAEKIESGFYRITLRYGFMEEPDIPRDLEKASAEGLDLAPERTTFFLGLETLIASRNRVGMALWREKLFAFMSKNARTASSFFHLPPNRVVELGAQIEI